jgi:hypothetical protein
LSGKFSNNGTKSLALYFGVEGFKVREGNEPLKLVWEVFLLKNFLKSRDSEVYHNQPHLFLLFIYLFWGGGGVILVFSTSLWLHH